MAADDVLLWRLDPSESWSDLTVEIVNEDSNKVDTYHVHKICLLFGTYKSSFFEGALRRNGGGNVGLTIDDSRDENERTIRIELGSDSAVAFPIFLDIMYDDGRRKILSDDEYSIDEDDRWSLESLSPQEAIVILHLADYFRVPKLIEVLQNQFMVRCREYIFENCFQTVLPGIIKYQNDPSIQRLFYEAELRAVQSLFWETERRKEYKDMLATCEGDESQFPDFGYVKKESYLAELVRSFDVPFFLGVLERCTILLEGRNLLEETNDCSASLAVFYFLKAHITDKLGNDDCSVMSKDDFDKLTSERFAPKISPDVAMQLLQIEYEYKELFAEDAGSRDATTSSLQKRCIRSLLSAEIISSSNTQEAEAILKTHNLPPDLIRVLLNGIKDESRVAVAPRKACAVAGEASNYLDYSIRLLSSNKDLDGTILNPVLDRRNKCPSYKARWNDNANQRTRHKLVTLYLTCRATWMLGTLVPDDYDDEEEEWHCLFDTEVLMWSDVPPAWSWNGNYGISDTLFLQIYKRTTGDAKIARHAS